MLSFSLLQQRHRNNFLSWISFFSCGCLDLMLDCNGFEGLRQYRFSFIYRNVLESWHFRLAARHFTDSILKGSFFDFLGRVLFLRNFLIFLRHIFRLFLKWKSPSRKSAFLFWGLTIAFTPTSAFLFTSELGFTFPQNWSNFAVECKWNRIFKTIKIWGSFGKLDGLFRTKSWNFSKTLHLANF